MTRLLLLFAMRLLVISDIHANLEALEAVLADAGPVDGMLCLGDLVGYGPNPCECVDRVRQFPRLTCLVGNHDLAALGTLDLNTFNTEAREAAEWTGKQLRPDISDYLGGLSPRIDTGTLTMAHASPRDPIWEYVVSPQQGPGNFIAFDSTVCLVGHTHVPRVLVESEDPGQPSPVVSPRQGESIDLHDGRRRIVNPGGVGQPRDGDPRAAYGLMDDETGRFIFRRIAYDFSLTQTKMRDAGLPEVLAARLAVGL